MALALTHGVGPAIAARLRRAFGSYRGAVCAVSGGAPPSGQVPARVAAAVRSSVSRRNWEDELELARRARARFALPGDDDYPDILTEVAGAPVGVFVSGETLCCLTPMIGVVGTRTPSPRGAAVETELAAGPLVVQRQRLRSLQADAARTPVGDSPSRRALFMAACRLRRDVALGNPLLDFDSNGTVSREELLQGWEMYLRPHPVNPEFRLDGRLDANGNGFVEPQEIGIAAGFTRGRPIPSFDERLEQLGWREERAAETTGTTTETRFESEVYKKLGMIHDKKLAVVGIKSGTKNVDEETAGGVMVFIENAFVNVGMVRVVDRQNIAKIVEEYEFQQSDLTDESTAVEIGKLSGADIIVIGSINYVGKQYYLNIKLISVETAEIIGSSIDKAEDATGFYEMCNQAVYKLF